MILNNVPKVFSDDELVSPKPFGRWRLDPFSPKPFDTLRQAFGTFYA